MRKITLLIASLFIAIGAMAQIQIGTEYRINVKNTLLYLSVGGTAANTHGEVYGASKSENNDNQIFTFIDAGGGQFYLKSNSGEYITYTGAGAGWNVNSDPSVDNAHALTFESVGDNEYKIKCYNASKGAEKYFKWEYVGASGKYHPFNDADYGAAATFVVEKAKAEIFTVVYNYKYNGEVVMTKTYEVAEGNSYPDTDLDLYQVTVNESKPDGKVTSNDTREFNVTVGDMPFEYAKTYAEIGNKWYNLVMHSNQGDNSRYRTYLGADNGETLAWGEHKSLTGAEDQYYWAFVGDPINGFRVVNKSKGDGYILSSDGTNNPLLREESNLGEGYNTTWQIAARTNNNGGDWVAEGDWFCLKYRDNWYMNANAGNPGYGIVNFWSADDNGSGILAVKPITINAAADYATYFAKTSFTIPETLGAKVYYVNIIENGYAKFEEITGIVKQETGVVVKFDAEENITYAPEFVSPGTATEISDNLLKGTTKRTLITKESNKAYYVLGMKEGIGFYNAVNGKNEGEFYNDAFKAYLEVPTSQGVNMLRFDFSGETTGVEEVEVESTVKTIYDLSGRKVSGMSAPGLYIVNGKKVLVK